ncbi:hypothetical protein SUGI_0062510 [Cryptomeria japonica]|nr:hypothetical protein SUGI_0062510 [Cryptomeria japonica]
MQRWICGLTEGVFWFGCPRCSNGKAAILILLPRLCFGVVHGDGVREKVHSVGAGEAEQSFVLFGCSELQRVENTLTGNFFGVRSSAEFFQKLGKESESFMSHEAKGLGGVFYSVQISSSWVNIVRKSVDED